MRILLKMTEEGGRMVGGEGDELLFWSRVNDVTGEGGAFSKRKCKDLQKPSGRQMRTCWDECEI